MKTLFVLGNDLLVYGEDGLLIEAFVYPKAGVEAIMKSPGFTGDWIPKWIGEMIENDRDLLTPIDIQKYPIHYHHWKTFCKPCSETVH